jgi:hypothetical protein
VQRAFQNSDVFQAMRPWERGLQYASHTVVALEDTLSMVFERPAHIAVFRRAFDRSLQEKVKVLRSVPNCANRPLGHFLFSGLNVFGL